MMDIRHNDLITKKKENLYHFALFLAKLFYNLNKSVRGTVTKNNYLKKNNHF